MECINLNNGLNIVNDINMSFIMQLTHLKELWLFNSFDGCQQIILKQGLKISQISKIIITDLNTEIISGLVGILSSLSLSNRNKPLHIYAPYGLREYIDLSKKYSHTNFCYRIYLHVLRPGIIIDHLSCKVYIMMKSYYFELLIFTNVKPGKFEIIKAKHFKVIPGPLYGNLKNASHFILPDGFMLDGTNFISNYYVGIKNNVFSNFYHHRRYVESIINSNILIYLS